jgi:hypothetical protein
MNRRVKLSFAQSFPQVPESGEVIAYGPNSRAPSAALVPPLASSAAMIATTP